METPWAVHRQFAEESTEEELVALVERCSLILGLSESARLEAIHYVTKEGIDLYTALTACLLQCVPPEVSSLSRLEIKTLLYGAIYGLQPEAVTG